MKIHIVETIEELKQHFGFQIDGDLIENDLDTVETECDLFNRKRLDAQVICTIAANSSGKCLDIGTSHGRSAFKIATNIKDGIVYTVNILPEQYEATAGELTTHLLSKEEIGSFYRQHDLKNIEQIYANTQTWEIPDYINNLSLVFVDGAHDSICVYTDTKKAYERIQEGGFILWHDFSPLFRSKYKWIDSVMNGVEKFLEDHRMGVEIVNLKNSWVGVLKKQVLQNGKLTETTIHGIKYSLDLTEYIDNEIYNKGCFEPGTTNAISNLCKNGMTALDIGANIGAHTFRMAALVGDKGKVIAFEPMSYAFARLKKNKELNNFSNIILEQIALSNELVKKKMHFDCSSSLSGNAPPEAHKHEIIQLMPLDIYLAQHGINNVDFIKIDVDGYEFKIIQGAIQTLRNSKPIIIIELCEYRLKQVGDNLCDLVEQLSDIGYSFYSEKDFKIFENLDVLIKSVPVNSSINVIAKHQDPFSNRNLSTVNEVQMPLEDISSSRVRLIEQMKRLRYLVVYPSHSLDRIMREESYISRIRNLGFNVEGFGIPCPNGWLPFPKLDEKWEARSSDLMISYNSLVNKLTTDSVLIASGGSMLHPEFLSQLNSFNVLICADDPESSNILSKPVAPSFDFCFTMTIGCLDMYHSWGCKYVDWLFHPVRPEMTDTCLNEDLITYEERDIDVIFIGGRLTVLKGEREQKILFLIQQFPQAFIAGTGWPKGRIENINSFYRRAKIGWNFHNNTLGTNNRRTIHLPVTGVMQICDNKLYLNELFKLDEEVIGYDTIEECAEKTRYYLEHAEERIKIAVQGWKRAITDYTEEKWWLKIISTIAPNCLKNFHPNLNQ